MRAGVIAVLFAVCGLGAETVHVDFFYAPGCARCEEVTTCVNGVSNRYAANVAICTIDLSVASNYEVLVAMETAVGVRKNEPLVVFIGSNALHGADAIVRNLDGRVAEGIAFGGVDQWRPVRVARGMVPVRDRFRKFTWLVVAGAGLADGINPCAFATLILFASLLASYRKSAREILLVALVFAVAVALTYTVLGLVLFTALRGMMNFQWLRTWLHAAIGGACLVLGCLSLRDAWKSRHGNGKASILSLPAGLRERIRLTLHERTGRTLVLSGVFVAGVLVSLMESVCTGQLYVPTLALMARESGTRMRALVMLGVYNMMFIVPLLALSAAVVTGVRAMQLVRLLERHAVPGRVVLAVFFIVVGVVLLAMI